MSAKDRDKAVEEALAGISRDMTVEPVTVVLNLLWQRAQEAERAENCKAVCSACRKGDRPQLRMGGDWTLVGWWHQVEETPGHPYDVTCIASPIRNRAARASRGAQGMSEVKIIERSDRGFHQYGEEPVRCTYGTSVEVYESSSAEGPHVWLKLLCDSHVLSNQAAGEGTAHLNEAQAREVIARLQAWVDEIPSRWGRASEEGSR